MGLQNSSSLFNAGMSSFLQILVVIGIIVPPLLAVFTTFGIMGLAHIEIYPIQMVIPFLILAIGKWQMFADVIVNC